MSKSANDFATGAGTAAASSASVTTPSTEDLFTEDYIVEIPEFEGKFEELLQTARKQIQHRSETPDKNVQDLTVEIMNLNSENPVMRIGKMHLFGRYETEIGTIAVLSADNDKLKEADANDDLPVEALTRKKIVFSTRPFDS